VPGEVGGEDVNGREEERDGEQRETEGGREGGRANMTLVLSLP